MAPPQVARAAPAKASNGPCDSDRLGGAINSHLIDFRILVEDLETIADWKAELVRRMARAQLCLELVGMTRERQDDLIAEARALKKVMAVLAARCARSA